MLTGEKKCGVSYCASVAEMSKEELESVKKSAIADVDSGSGGVGKEGSTWGDI